MGGIASAIGGAIGGVADAVGSVAEAAVDVAGDVIDAVASNPLLLAAAVATPFALEALATEATVGAGALTAADIGAGFGMTALETGIPSALEIGAGLGYGTAAGLGAGTALGAAEALGTGFSLAGLGSIYADGAITSAFNFAPLEQATTFGTSILDATGSNLATFNSSQTAASTVMGDTPTYAFDSNYLSSNTFAQAKDAASLVDSPSMSFSNAISDATGGAIAPSPSTSVFSNAWDSAKGIYNQANSFVDKIGQTIAPNADPMVQKAITNFSTNMVTSGGDLEQSLKSSAIGPVAGLAGKEVTSLAGPALGDFGSKLAGSAASSTTGALLSGASPEQALMGAGIGATGSAVTNLTGSPLIGGAAKTALGSLASGSDLTNNLLGYGINAGVNAGANQLVNQLGLPTSGLLGQITKPIIGNITSQVKGALMPTSQAQVLQASKAPTNISPLKTSSLTKVLQSGPTSATTQSTASGVLPTSSIPAQKVDVSKLKPVDLSTLGIKT